MLSLICKLPFSLSLMAPFEAQKFQILRKSNLFIVSFIAYVFDVISRKPLPNPTSQRFTPVFFKSFIVLALTFVSGQFWVDFCIWYDIKVELHSFKSRYQFFQHHLLKRHSLLHCIAFAHHQSSVDSVYVDLFLGSIKPR